MSAMINTTHRAQRQRQSQVTTGIHTICRTARGWTCTCQRENVQHRESQAPNAGQHQRADTIAADLQPVTQPHLPATPRRMAQETTLRFDLAEDRALKYVAGMCFVQFQLEGVPLLMNLAAIRRDIEAFMRSCFELERKLGCGWDWPE